MSMETTGYIGESPLVMQLHPVIDLSDDQLFDFALLNRDIRIERNAQGELVIMPPTGTETGDRNAEITMQLRLWAKQDGTGTTFDSSAGFRLPNTAVRSPDASWIIRSRLDRISADQMRRFAPICPDFVIELRSPNDSLDVVQDKMVEYIENGAVLGWLIDPERRQVSIYRPNQPVEVLESPSSVSGDPVLIGFVLDLSEIW